MYMEHFDNPNFSVAEMMVFRVRGVSQTFHVFDLHRNHDLDDRIYDWLITSMAAVEAEDVCASFL